MLERTIFKHLNVYGVGVPPLRVHTAGECVISRRVAKGSSAFRHTAGVFVMGCRVAKGSFAFRFRAKNTWGAGPWEPTH
ncbi:hypothetical protein [Desulfosporosinus sp. Sb-LF]|uniref:hypothetical protein n=1 Tax=Desulfosporosinus sp. Sb-LF TaxID=2560027 RepID=UPI00107F6CB5|nr:hypothetical protein [Desulfosporosinus sp. Sb-LF]TGE30990.1 hypothetical protein E4K68_19530 [Desulfosporosinus sp. Sb-LF]